MGVPFLYLKNELMNWVGFLHADTYSEKSKVALIFFWAGIIKNRCLYLVHRTLKSAISRKWIDKLSWFFTCWYKFMKATSYFSKFWVGKDKNGSGF